jgi:hypothetical protein
MSRTEKNFGLVTVLLLCTLAFVTPAFSQVAPGENAIQAPTTQPQSPSTVVASLDGHQLTRGELESLKKYLAPGAPVEQEQKLIDFWKLSTAMADQARQAKLESDPEALLVLNLLRNKFMGDLLVRREQMNVTVSDDEVKANYDANQDNPAFRQGVFLTAQIIASEKREDIAAIKQELVEGKDFDQVFEAHKDQTAKLLGLSDPSIVNVSSTILTENLGQTVVSAMNMVPEGEVVGPRKATTAWVLFKVTERKPGDLVPFEKVQEEIRAKLLREKQMQAGKDIVQKAQEAAGIAPKMPKKPVSTQPATTPTNNDQKK